MEVVRGELFLMNQRKNNAGQDQAIQVRGALWCTCRVKDELEEVAARGLAYFKNCRMTVFSGEVASEPSKLP